MIPASPGINDLFHLAWKVILRFFPSFLCKSISPINIILVNIILDNRLAVLYWNFNRYAVIPFLFEIPAACRSKAKIQFTGPQQ